VALISTCLGQDAKTDVAQDGADESGQDRFQRVDSAENAKNELEVLVSTLKSNSSEMDKQIAAHKVWMMGEDKDPAVQARRQLRCVKLGCVRPLLRLVDQGSEETKWRASRALVQVAFENRQTTETIVSSGAVKVVTGKLKDLEGCTDRVKEALLQLLSQICDLLEEEHPAVVASGIVEFVIIILRSITIPPPVKKAAVNVIFALSLSESGHSALLKLDAATALVPISKSGKSALNSVRATLALGNLIGRDSDGYMPCPGRRRTPPLVERRFSSSQLMN
jgi:hypothetical protein